MPSNSSTLLVDGDYHDWIELYNPSNEDIDLSDYTLSDDQDELDMWTFPSGILAPNEYLVVYASKLDGDPGLTEIHTNFKISSSGESIFLSKDMEVVQMTPDTLMLADLALVFDDGEWLISNDPTPGATNTLSTVKTVEFSQAGGIYNQSVNLILSADAGYDIRYTLDNTNPSNLSQIFEDQIIIDSSTHLRAQIFDGNEAVSEIFSETYIHPTHVHNLPVVSLNFNPVEMFDSLVGIYPNFYGLNKIDAQIEYFKDGVSQFISSGNLAIHGGDSRKAPQKSLKFNGDINYQLFPEKEVDQFKSIILRAGGQDKAKTYIRDAVKYQMFQGLVDVDLQGFQPAVLYLNGEYWGIQNIREKTNEDYLYTNYGLDESQILSIAKPKGDILDVSAGSIVPYEELIATFEGLDTSEESNFAVIDTLIDVSNFLDYYILQIFSANSDWPENNLKLWISTEEGAKWRWILYDTDLTFGRIIPNWFDSSYDAQTFMEALGEISTIQNSEASTLIFSKAMQNPVMQEMFLQRLEILLVEVFNSDRLIGVLDKLVNELESEMPYHIAKWDAETDQSQYQMGSMTNWEYHLNIVRNFLELRPTELVNQINEYYDVQDSTTLKFDYNSEESLVFIDQSQVLDTTHIHILSNLERTLLFKTKPGYALSSITRVVEVNDTIVETTQIDTSVYVYIPSIGNTTFIVETIPVDLSEYASLIINEVVSSNDEGDANPDGKYSDWIEIYNLGSESLDMAGLTIMDSENSYTIPYNMTSTIIEPDSFLIIWANGNAEGDFLNTNFKISSGGEKIKLLLGDITLDSIIVPQLEVNTSYGRINDELMIYSQPSIGLENPDMFDCYSDWEGSAAIDSCEVCSGGNTGITPDDCLINDLRNNDISEELRLFPNPSSSLIYLSKDVQWTLFSAEGLEIDSGFSNQINIESLPSNIYFLVTEHSKIKILKI